jgi:hypothetical protein|tara:strand:+ start:674 stop:988 length:315 start_codon:yes stop_codon:yes gene_type:complete
MSQVSQITIDNVAFGTFRSNLNSALSAINSSHSGTSAPATAVAGTLWVDTATSGVLKLKMNDGTDNVEILQLNISSNALSSTMSVTGTIAETDPNALPLAIALG